jgi:ribosomal protein L32
MSVRMRHTSSHSKNRRSHHALTANSIVADKESGALRLPHRLDETTGMYRGKQILPKKEMKAKADHDKKVAKAKKEHNHEHVDGAKEPIHIDTTASTEKKGLMGRMTLGKAKSRSGFGGGSS